MKHLKQLSLVWLTIILMLTACHSEEESFQMETFGEIKLSSMQVTAETEPLVTASRVASEINDYLVTIYTEAGELVQEWKYSEMPEIFTLKTGRYKLYAHAPEVEGAAFDTPYCASEEKAFEIKQDEITEIGEVKCTLNNVKVTIVYAEDLKPLLGDDVKVTVTVGKETLEYTKDQTLSGFFHGEAENNVVDVVLQGSIEGVETTISKSYGGIALGTELIVTYNLKEASNGIDPGTGGELGAAVVSIDGKVVVVDESGSLLPEEDEILDFGNPKVEGDGFDITQPVTNLEQTVVVNLIAPEGIAHVYVKITSDNTSFDGVIKEMFGEEGFDLAYPGAFEETLTGLKLPVGEKVINQQLVKFDVTEFMPLLKGEFAGQHYFSIEVVDNYNMSAKATLTVDSRNAE